MRNGSQVCIVNIHFDFVIFFSPPSENNVFFFIIIYRRVYMDNTSMLERYQTILMQLIYIYCVRGIASPKMLVEIIRNNYTFIYLRAKSSTILLFYYLLICGAIIMSCCVCTT